MSRNTQVTIIALILLLCCCLILAVVGFWAWSEWISAQPASTPQLLAAASPTFTLSPLPFRVTPTPLSTPTPVGHPRLVPTAVVVPTATALPTLAPTPGALTTEEHLLAAELPQRDVRLLAERLTKIGPIPVVVHEAPPVYELGDETQFWVGNMDTLEQFDVTAILRYRTPHLYMWVEKDLSYDQEALIRSAENFENHTYPTNRAFFGSEWSPGVDADPHLHILHSSGAHMGGIVAGYYSSADEYSRLANPYSNEREMFYISLDGTRPGTDFYDGVLAHEFQHMIHWANDRNEETWVTEGCSELAAYLNGYDPGGFEWVFMSHPDVQLTTWPQGGSAAPHYGSSYLFMAYFLGRFGEDAVKRVVAHPDNGIAGFEALLSDYGLAFADVFADWVIANYVDNIAHPIPGSEARYTYPDHVVGPVSVDVTHDGYPVQRQSTVHQYAADYVELKSSSEPAGMGDLTVEFAGDTQALLVPTAAHSGEYAWWSNRGDESDATLTRAFDLRRVEQATLRVWMWYDIEGDWDYAYVEASVDGGQTWDILPGPSTTTSNPNGNSFGPAYTGQSGGWIEEKFDLSPYAGREVLVRFEYITDDAVNHPGWLIDDVSIPELGYDDDIESGTGEWSSAGFIYSNNRVSQRYLVQLIVFGRQVRVLRMVLDKQQRGSVELRGLGSDAESAVLVISALAPATTEVASYRYEIRPLDR
jgi:immune inhibitor A